MYSDSGRRKEFGFVEYKTKEEAAAALKSMAGQFIGGRPITIEYSLSENKKANRKGNNNTLVVKNLGPDTDKGMLEDAFHGCTSVTIPAFSDTGKKKGFAFVQFGSEEDVVKAREAMTGQAIDGRRITIESYGGKAAPELFIKNLSYETDEQTLQDAFVGCLSVSVPVWPDTGRRKGLAFVRYRTTEEAVKARDSMSGQSIDGRRIAIDYSRENVNSPNNISNRGWPFIRSGRRGGRRGR